MNKETLSILDVVNKYENKGIIITNRFEKDDKQIIIVDYIKSDYSFEVILYNSCLHEFEHQLFILYQFHGLNVYVFHDFC